MFYGMNYIQRAPIFRCTGDFGSFAMVISSPIGGAEFLQRWCAEDCRQSRPPDIDDGERVVCCPPSPFLFLFLLLFFFFLPGVGFKCVSTSSGLTIVGLTTGLQVSSNPVVLRPRLPLECTMKELGGLMVAIAVHADDSFQGVRIAYNAKKKFSTIWIIWAF
jgi:hypothetical protein